MFLVYSLVATDASHYSCVHVWYRAPYRRIRQNTAVSVVAFDRLPSTEGPSPVDRGGGRWIQRAQAIAFVWYGESSSYILFFREQSCFWTRKIRYNTYSTLFRCESRVAFIENSCTFSFNSKTPLRVFHGKSNAFIPWNPCKFFKYNFYVNLVLFFYLTRAFYTGVEASSPAPAPTPGSSGGTIPTSCDRVADVRVTSSTMCECGM